MKQSQLLLATVLSVALAGADASGICRDDQPVDQYRQLRVQFMEPQRELSDIYDC